MSVGQAANLITIVLPQDALAPIAESPEAFANEMRLAAAIEWYREGRISQGRAAEIAGRSRIDFLDALFRAKVPACQVTVDELMEEVGRAAKGAGDTQRMAADQREEPAMVGQESVMDVPFTPEEAEAHYRPLGRLKGDLAAPAVQDAARAFWQSAGEHGARWLSRRLRREVQVETLHAAGSELADLGPVAVVPIVDELGNNPTPDQAWTLLKALGWMGNAPSSPRIDEASVELLLAKFFQHHDADVREAAARAMRLLPPERAGYWLRRQEREEKDREVVLTIEEELTRIGCDSDPDSAPAIG